MELIDAIDGTIEIDLCDNGDGVHATLNLLTSTSNTSGVGISLTADQLIYLADQLQEMAAGLDW